MEYAGSILILICLGAPGVLTIINLVYAMKNPEGMYTKKREQISELLTYFLGIPLSFIFTELNEIIITVDWNESLVNNQVHTPIWTGGALTILVLAGIGVSSYIAMRLMPLPKTPPLFSVVCIAGIYIGIFLSVIWIIQLSSDALSFVFLGLLPFNCIVLGIKVIRCKIYQWNQLNNRKERMYHNAFLNKMNQKLLNSEHWPFYAFVLMFPILIICILLLLLFGQQPDALIKAWTETSDWALSARKAPPNLQFDEHYLCTVAAGGHEGIVKPKRMGIRHGHRVVVNRQLCVANAFEQLISEKTPRFHKVVRGVYDKYGYPIARLVRSKYVADIIYFLMKPLEWIFLIVLYCMDADPESRIAMQYIAPISKGFKKEHMF